MHFETTLPPVSSTGYKPVSHVECKVPQGSTRFYKVPRGSTRVYKVLQGSTGLHKVLQGSTRFHKGLQGSTRFHRAPQGSTGSGQWTWCIGIQTYQCTRL